MTAPLTLRMISIAIAVAGIADPVLTIPGHAPRPMTITILDGPSLVLPQGPATRRERAYDAANRLRGELSDVFDTRVREQSTAADANPCPVEGACLVISDGARPRRLSASGMLGAVRIGAALTPNVAIRALHLPTQTTPAAVAAVDVDLWASGMGGTNTDLLVFDGDLVVGQTSHTWPGGDGVQTATVRVEWTPVQSGLREIRVAIPAIDGEATGLDNEAHTATEVAIERYELLLYEPRPTWTGTFVRRALEDDPRFVVRARARVANAIAVTSGAPALTAATLASSNVRLVVITAPEQLTASEVTTLEQFMRVRGGSVVALIDVAPTGPSQRLLPFTITERRENEPIQVGALKASEFLTLEPRDAVTSVIAAAGNSPVMVARPFGNGRLMASALIDAWRFRGENDAFARFWQAALADAADAAGDVLMLDVTPRLAYRGDRLAVDIEWRPLIGIPDAVDVRATVVCGERRQNIRLWPSGTPGRFEGEFVATADGKCRVDAILNGITRSTALLIRDRASVIGADGDELTSAITAHGGLVVAGGNENELVSAFRRAASPTRISTQVHPLRSPWWVVPFVACLGAEWWLRRRAGRT
jgi:hypothetical protein